MSVAALCGTQTVVYFGGVGLMELALTADRLT
jgi:hypothetical protein